MGDGGLITVNSENLKNRIVALRNHGGAVRYYHDEIGVNSRLDEIQAAILRIKLNYIDEWNKARRDHAKTYNELFAGCSDIQTPHELDNTYCVYHQYTVKSLTEITFIKCFRKQVSVLCFTILYHYTFKKFMLIWAGQKECFLILKKIPNVLFHFQCFLNLLWKNKRQWLLH